MPTESPRGLLSAAWQGFADKIAASAATVAAADFADNARDQAEGHRYLARLIAYALQEQFCFSDPEFPAFHRGLDDLAPWGAPNVDNVYLMANIDGRHCYRIHGNVNSIGGFIVNVNEGVYPVFPGYRTVAEISHREMDIGEDGRFELILSSEPQPGNWIRLTHESRGVGIRQYIVDWERHAPAEFHIVRLGNEGRAPAPITPERTAEALHQAVDWAQTLAAYYLKRLDSERSARTFNILPPPEKKVPGSAYTHYGIAFYELADDEALLIEMPAEPAPYWSFQLYNFWNEFTDPANRITSLNHTQAHIDADGLFRAVIAHRDPGTANWLDTAGYGRGYLWYRWIWADTVPVPKGRVVKLADIPSLMPAGSPRISEAQRREQVMRRREQIDRRYHR